MNDAAAGITYTAACAITSVSAWLRTAMNMRNGAPCNTNSRMVVHNAIRSSPCRTHCTAMSNATATVNDARAAVRHSAWMMAATATAVPTPSAKPMRRTSIAEVNGESPGSTKFVSCKITSGAA